MSFPSRRWLFLVPLLFGLGAATVVFWLGLRHDRDIVGTSPLTMPGASVIERGAYLARLGDCAACHTAQGGAAYAGGRSIDTAFGRFWTPNITPDEETGLGKWSADDFWLALHEGRSPDGQLLYPVFPYTNYTRMTRDDSDALYAYMRSVKPVKAPAREHELKFPISDRASMVAWRALFFRPAVFKADAAKSEEWNRGAYLVQGLAHCSACHEARNTLGGTQVRDNPAGGLVLDWYAPVLSAKSEAGVQDWPKQDVIDLLSKGTSAHGTAMGPMGEVVFESLQQARGTDIQAMANYLQSLPVTAAPEVARAVGLTERERPKAIARGQTIYTEHCAQCHGDDGRGRSPAAPALAGNRAVVMDPAVNAIRVVLFGGYTPGTAGNPRPFGMPPYASVLSRQDVADVLTYIRGSFGNQARSITAVEVDRNSSGPLW
jgi:mono/diheme cytochrome c family protein